jgi:hypothetical protein
MMTPLLRKALVVSFLGHLATFGIFNFSFGKRIPEANYSAVSFWGQVLPESEINQANLKLANALNKKRELFKPELLNKSTAKEYLAAIKPAVLLQTIHKKNSVIEIPLAPFAFPAKKEPAVYLRPLLPYSFVLYFKDRQTAHVELLYKIILLNGSSYPSIKRRISSGNLEVDLLSMRYISHYLSVRKTSDNSESWKSIKIDLSQKPAN